MEDPIEIQPLMPLSGQVPIQINPENHARMTSTLEEQRQINDRIQQDSLPWIPILLVPLLAVAMLLALLKIKTKAKEDFRTPNASR